MYISLEDSRDEGREVAHAFGERGRLQLERHDRLVREAHDLRAASRRGATDSHGERVQGLGLHQCVGTVARPDVSEHAAAPGSTTASYVLTTIVAPGTSNRSSSAGSAALP